MPFRPHNYHEIEGKHGKRNPIPFAAAIQDAPLVSLSEGSAQKCKTSQIHWVPPGKNGWLSPCQGQDFFFSELKLGLVGVRFLLLSCQCDRKAAIFGFAGAQVIVLQNQSDSNLSIATGNDV